MYAFVKVTIMYLVKRELGLPSIESCHGGNGLFSESVCWRPRLATDIYL